MSKSIACKKSTEKSEPSNPTHHDRSLESWKEIASYLCRDVRTVQRWEASEALPVHRLLHGKGASIYAHKEELDSWRDKRATCNSSDANSQHLRAQGADRRFPEGFLSAHEVAVLRTVICKLISLTEKQVITTARNPLTKVDDGDGHQRVSSEPAELDVSCPPVSQVERPQSSILAPVQ